MRNNVVFITYHFPPGKGAGGKRISRLIRSMSKSSRLDFDYRVVTVDQSCAEGIVHNKDIGEGIDNSKIFYLENSVSIMSIFDRTFGWYRAALKYSCKCVETILNQNNNQDKVIVFSSQPPAVTHYIALKIKNFFNGKVYWIADFRDPWAKHYWGMGRISKFYQKKIQSKVLRQADLVLTTTDKVVSLFPQDIAGKHYCLPNSVDANIFEDTMVNPTFKKIILTHLGDLDYEWRDPGPFLNAFSLAHQSVVEGETKDIEIHFWGNHGKWNNKTIEDYIVEFGLQDQVFIHEFIPHSEALVEILSSDLLILFAMNQKAQIPSKVYEYLLSKKPIFAFCEKDSATGELLSRFSHVTMIDTYDVIHISEELSRIIPHFVKRNNLDEDIRVSQNITTEVVVDEFLNYLQKQLK